jgi:hypothetical protein
LLNSLHSDLETSILAYNRMGTDAITPERKGTL